MDVLQIATAFMSRVLPSSVNSSREQTGTLGYGRRETLTPPGGPKRRNSTLRTSGEGLEEEEIGCSNHVANEFGISGRC
jgi:hypothetical protein